MPRQNRVTPFGTIIATPARGTLLGNRGCLHDDQRRIRRLFQTRRWIICQLAFKGRRRPIMAPGQYTELFFLDEATALAAGHRPCAECSRQRFSLFRDLWAAANPDLAGTIKPAAPAIDAALHLERISPAGDKLSYTEQLGKLPAGVMVVIKQEPYLWLAGRLWPWQPAGYGPAQRYAGDQRVQVLTPPSVVRTLAAGYPMMVHPSAHFQGGGSVG